MKKIIINTAFTLALCCLNSFLLLAQTPPLTPDVFVDQSTGVTQVVTDSRTVNGCERTVVAWDGNNAGLAWDDQCGGTGQISIPTGITHMDIALFEGSFFDNLVLVFVLGGNLYTQGYTWQGGAYSLVPGSLQTLSSLGTAVDCQIDSDDMGRGVVTWIETQQSGYQVVMARSFSMLFLFPNGPAIDISSNAIPPNMQSAVPPFTNVARPDVTIATHGQTQPATVHFSYLLYDPNGGTHLFYQVEEFIDVINGIPLYPIVFAPAHTSSVSVNVSYPRISSLVLPNGLSIEGQATIVFAEEDFASGHYRIMSYNGMLGGANQVNTSGGETCTNARPAITMTGCNQYVVAWEYEDLQGCGLNNLNPGTGTNIIAAQLDEMGNPFGANYQILNFNYNTPAAYEYGPALAGRFSQNNLISSVFFDGNEEIYHKATTCSDALPYFRTQAPPSTNLTLSPNPGTDQFQLVHNWEIAQATSVELVDVMGKVIVAENFGITDRVDWSYSTTDLASGVYLIRLQFGEKMEVRKWLKQ